MIDKDDKQPAQLDITILCSNSSSSSARGYDDEEEMM